MYVCVRESACMSVCERERERERERHTHTHTHTQNYLCRCCVVTESLKGRSYRLQHLTTLRTKKRLKLFYVH